MNHSEAYPYPKCSFGNQAKSVCLHQKCDLYPFFCSTCDEESCELKHRHTNKITSIGFKEFIKHVMELKRPNSDLVDACNTYSKTLLDFQSKVYAFVLKELKEVEAIKTRSPVLPEGETKVVARILKQEYVDLKGKETDMVWLAKSSKPVEDIAYIQSKTEEIHSLAEDFRNLITILNDGQEPEELQEPSGTQQTSPKPDKSKGLETELIKIQEENKNIQKILREKQEQVTSLEEAIQILNRQNEELILSRDQLMSHQTNETFNKAASPSPQPPLPQQESAPHLSPRGVDESNASAVGEQKSKELNEVDAKQPSQMSDARSIQNNDLDNKESETKQVDGKEPSQMSEPPSQKGGHV